MAFNNQSGPSSQNFPSSSHFAQYRTESSRATAPPPPFDIAEWYPKFQSCLRFFVEHAQHTPAVQAVCAFINIQLPSQKPSTSSAAPSRAQPSIYPAPIAQAHAQAISVIPYIRRLIATGYDKPEILHGFFGDDWRGGIGELHEIERRNYLFAAKSSSWMEVKQAYDISVNETIPYLSPLKDASEKEIQAAEATWSEWLAMQDWMIGPRAPDGMNRSPRVKREPRE